MRPPWRAASVVAIAASVALTAAVGCSKANNGNDNGDDTVLAAGGEVPVTRDGRKLTDFDPDCFTARTCASACRNKVPGACGRLALIYQKGWGVQPDERRAAELRKRNCAAGDALSCLLQAESFDKNTPQRLEWNARARRLAEPACLAGSPQACRIRAYASSNKVPWLVRACEAGHARACLQLTVLSLADDVPPELETWEERLGDRGIAGIQTDTAARQCRRGWMEACIISGKEADLRGALPKLRRTCQSGYGPSCARLANALNGLSRPAEANQATIRACRLRIEGACEAVYDPRFIGRYEVVSVTSNARGCDRPGAAVKRDYKWVQIKRSSFGALEMTSCKSASASSCEEHVLGLPSGLGDLTGDSFMSSRIGDKCQLHRDELHVSLTKAGVRIVKRSRTAPVDCSAIAGPAGSISRAWPRAKQHASCSRNTTTLRRVSSGATD